MLQNEFSEENVGPGLYGWYIDHVFIVCMTNLLLEGQFNLLDQYTDACHDELLRETIIQFLNWQLSDERTRNRASELRSRSVGSDKDGTELDHEHRSKTQLEHWMEMAHEYAQRYSADEMQAAGARYDVRTDEQSECFCSHHIGCDFRAIDKL